MNDLTYEDLVTSVNLVNEFCKMDGTRFFLDTSDLEIYNIGGKRLVDLYGWVVPESEASAFERAWMDEADCKDDDFGEKWYQAIVWDDRNGVATPVILDD